MANRGKKGEEENTKIWISREWKELFRWNEKHFSRFLTGYDLVKNKNLIKTGRHNFKLSMSLKHFEQLSLKTTLNCQLIFT